jgi:hypothetical protein
VIRSAAVALIGIGFVAIAIFLIASGHLPWTSPDPWCVMTFFAGCAIIGLVETVQGWWPPRPVSSASRFAAQFNRAQLGVFALAGALWCASGWLGLYGNVYPAWVAWMVLAFGGICAGLLGGFVFDGREQVIVDHEGIADRRIVRDKIPWSDVRAISVGRTGGVPSVAVTLHDPARYRAKRPWFAKTVGRSVEPVHVISLQLAASFEDIVAAVTRFAPPELQPHEKGAIWLDDDAL